MSAQRTHDYSGIIRGQVKDGSSNNFLAGVIIIKDNTGKKVQSAGDGTYIFKLDRGVHNLIFSTPGYQTKVITDIQIGEKETIYLNITLLPLSTKPYSNINKVKETDSVEIKDSVVKIKMSNYSKGTIANPIIFHNADAGYISKPLIPTGTEKDLTQSLKRLNNVIVSELPNSSQLSSFTMQGIGERYNQLLINGSPIPSFEKTVRAFPLSSIPIEIVESIQLTDNPTPSLPSDFSSGSLSISTRELPEREMFYIQIGGLTEEKIAGKGFSSDHLSLGEKLGWASSNRFLPSAFPTTKSEFLLEDKNTQEKADLLNLLPNSLAAKKRSSLSPTPRLKLGWEKLYNLKNGTRIGLVSFIDYQYMESIHETEVQVRPNVINNPYPFANATQPIVKSYYNSTDYESSARLGIFINGTIQFRKNKISLKTIWNQIFNDIYSEKNYIYKPDEDTLANSGINYKVEQYRYLNFNLSGDHSLGLNGRLKLNWNASYTRLKKDNPDERNILLRENTTGNSTLYEIARPLTEPLPDRTAVGRGTLDANLDAILTNTNRSWVHQGDHNFTGNFNLSIPFNFSNKSQILSGGFFIQTHYRELYSNLLLLQGSGYKSLDSLLAPGSYYPGGNSVVEYYNKLIKGGGSFNSSEVNADNLGNYTGTTNIGATYINLHNKLSRKLNINWGIRFESSSQLISSVEYTYFAGFKKAQMVPLNENTKVNQFHLLPSINIHYQISGAWLVQAGYSKTIGRPTMHELSVYRSYDPSSFMVTTGNTLLENSETDNFHGSLHWVPTSFSQFQISGKYKRIFQPIEYLVSAYTVSAGNLISKPFNMPEGELYSFQVSFKTALAGNSSNWLSYITLNGGGSYNHSNVKAGPLKSLNIPSVTAHTLSGTPELMINGGLTFQHPKWPMISVLYNHSGDYIHSVGSGIEYILADGKKVLAIPNYRMQGREQLDIQIAQNILKEKIQILGGIANLLKSPYTLYQDLNGNEKFDRALKLSNTPRGGYYAGGVDNVVSNISTQRKFYLAISYRFNR